MLYMWLDTSHTGHGWRLNTSPLRQMLQRDPAPVYDCLYTFVRTAQQVGYRSQRVERAFVRAIVDVRETQDFLEVLANTDEEIRQLGIRLTKYIAAT